MKGFLVGEESKEVLQETDLKKTNKLLNDVKVRKLRYFGHSCEKTQ